ncbi:MAG TPA: CBS domain-containing protein [Steroidobacteraceae bacterium]|nr:CBS domain-containing protein [Steroidobacteraceae bacterium]
MYVNRVLGVARTRLAAVPETALLKEAAQLLNETHINLVVVCNSAGAMVGVVSKTDVVRRISQCVGASCTTAVASVMTRDVVYCRTTEYLQTVWSRMKERNVLHVPVVDEYDAPVGVLNARDALQALMTEVENEEALLRDYVLGIGYQ